MNYYSNKLLCVGLSSKGVVYQKNTKSINDTDTEV